MSQKLPLVFDPDNLPPKLRLQYEQLGAKFNEFDVRLQWEKNFAGLDAFPDVTAIGGFGPSHLALTRSAYRQHTDAITTRQGARIDSKTTSAVFLLAIDEAKGARLVAIPVLTSAAETLKLMGDEERVVRIKVVLDSASSAGWDLDKLESQLKSFDRLLQEEVIELAAGARPTENARREIEEALVAIARVRSGRAGVPGTPAETARLNVLDGFLVSMARLARKAARAAARKARNPHIANAFELDELYKTKVGARSKAKTKSEPAPAASA